MNISSTEIILMLLIVVAFAVAYFYLIDFKLQNNELTVNFTKGVKNIVKVVNSSSDVKLNATNSDSVNISVIKTTSIPVTTSTIKIMFFDTPGVITSEIKSSDGNILINCGTNISVANKMFLNNGIPLYGAVLTKMDSDRIGVCGRVFMLIPPSIVYDVGSVGSGNYFDNYILSVGGKRSLVGQDFKFNFGSISGSVIKSIDDTNTLKFIYKNISYIYSDGCDNVCLRSLVANKSYNVLVVANGDINDDSLMSVVPPLVIVSNVSNETIGLAHKYGVKLVDVSKTGDFGVIIDNKGINYNVIGVV